MSDSRITNILLSKNIKVLGIDADNTLYRVKNVKKLYEEVTRDLEFLNSINPGELYEELRQLMKTKRITYIYITKQSWFLTLALLSNLTKKENIDLPEIYEEANHLYNRFKKLLTKNLELTPIGEVLKNLSEKYRIIVVSEEEKTFLMEKLKAANLIHYVDDMITSSDIGFLKPHEEYYKLLIKKANQKPEAILYIDDDKRNVESAKKFGINALTNKEFENLLKQLKV